MLPPTDPRSPLVAALHAAFVDAPWALAAWLGGSDASGRTDAWSDVDLLLIVEDDAVERAFDVARGTLEAIAPMVRSLRLPEPTWHGHAQMFFQLAGWAEWHMIDLVVQRRSGPAERFLEPERHGTQVVLFDRAGLVRPQPMDRAAHAARVAARREQILARFELLQHLVTKAILRGDVVEAADRYMSFTLRPLVDLLRIQSCPDRFDFGMRYLDRDLPPALRREIVSIALPGGLEELAAAHERAKAMFQAAKVRGSERGPSADHDGSREGVGGG
ncbi:MAG: nucleotidyltransferase domain-containing protein [Phycisphaerales bacterium]